MTIEDRPLSPEASLVGLILHQGAGRLADLRRAAAGASEALWLEGLIERVNFPYLTQERRALVRGVAALMATAQSGAGRNARSSGSVGGRMGDLWRDQNMRPSTEQRFLILTDADVDGVLYHLRHAIALLGPTRQPSWPDLMRDIQDWPDPVRKKRTVHRWARDFYRTPTPVEE